MKGRFEPRVEKKIFVPACFAFVLLQFINNSLFALNSVLIIIFSILLTFLMTLIYDAKWYQRLLSSVAIYLYMALAEIVVGNTITIFLQINPKDMLDTPPVFATMTVLAKFTTYILMLITKKQTFDISLDVTKKYTVLLMLLPLASSLIIILFLWVCYKISAPFFMWVVLLTSIVLIFANISIFEIIGRQRQMYETEQKLLKSEMYLENQRTHYEQLYKYDSEMRMFRHNIRHEIMTLLGLIKNGENETAQRALQDNLGYIDELSDRVVNTGDPIFDSILQQKVAEAKAKGVKLKLFVRFGEPLKTDIIELGILMGNAIDNAVEATQKVTNEVQKLVSFKLVTTKNRVIITVDNPVEYDIDVTKLKSSKSDKRNHGIGVATMTDLSRKNDGTVTFKCEDRMFRIEINIANAKRKRM